MLSQLPCLGVWRNSRRRISDHAVAYSSVKVEIDRAHRRATITVLGPTSDAPKTAHAIHAHGADFWPLRVAREG